MNRENETKSNSRANVPGNSQRDTSFENIRSVYDNTTDENRAKPDHDKGDVEDITVNSVNVNETTGSKEILKTEDENSSDQLEQETKHLSNDVEKNKNSDQGEDLVSKTENVDGYIGKNREDVISQDGSSRDIGEVITEFKDGEDHKEPSVDEEEGTESKDGEDHEGTLVDNKKNMIVSSKDGEGVETESDVNKNGDNDDTKVQYGSLIRAGEVEEGEKIGASEKLDDNVVEDEKKGISGKMDDGIKEGKVEETLTSVGVESSGKSSVEKTTENSNEVSNNKVEEEDTPDVVQNTGGISSKKDESNYEGKGVECEAAPDISILESHTGDFQDSENHSEIPSGNIDDISTDLPVATDDVESKNDNERLVVVAIAEDGLVEEQPEKVPAEMPVEEIDGKSSEESLATEEVVAKLLVENTSKTPKELPVEEILAEGSAEPSEVPVKLALTPMEEMPSSSTETNSEKAGKNCQLTNEVSVEQVEEGLSADLNADMKENQAKQHVEARLGSSSSGTVYSMQTDYLTRQVIANQEKEIYLEEKLAETNRELEVAERKVKDLQLRLKRFVKDDEAKDCKIRQMEMQYKELADQMQRIEEALVSKNNNAEKIEATEFKKSSSHVCVIF